jgi:hypothetical protein
VCCGFCIYDLSDGDLKLCVVHFCVYDLWDGGLKLCILYNCIMICEMGI